MRLTLRTLLAYLDDVLETPDSQELAKKIEESKFATELVHRIRTSVRKLRLDAPKLEGKGMGLDPNTVAEYLDSTLPTDRVPDFEKVCLESDRHLAEVASCHQVLAIVLGEPAHVENSLRERIYRIGSMSAAELEQAAQRHAALADSEASIDTKIDQQDSEPLPPPKPMAAASSKKTASATHDSTENLARPKPEVPDYLREAARPRFWPIALTLLLAFGIGIGALRLMGPLDATHPLAKAFGVNPVEVAVNGPNSPNENPAVPDTPAPENDGTAPRPTGGADKLSKNPDDATLVPNETVPPSRSTPVVPPSVEGTAVKVPNVNRPADEIGTPPLPARPVGEPAPATDSKLPAAEPKDPAKVASLPTDTTKPILPADPLASPATPSATKPAILLSTEVGRLNSSDQVVGHFDNSKSIWRRLPRAATLNSAERYVVLPTYRPLVSLKSGVQIMFVGEASFELAPAEKMDDAGVALHYGRAVISTGGRAGSRVFFDLGGEQGTVTFGDGDSEIAVEVRRYLPPGSAPENDPAVMLVQCYVTRGRVLWQPIEGAGVPLSAGQLRVAVTGQPIQSSRFDVPPAWMETNTINKLDRDASLELESFITVDKPLVLSLSEKTDYRKTEIRSLAARCLVSVDEPEAAIRELGDDRQYSYWFPAIESLREALARSPAAAERVKQTLERKRIDDGATLYRLLCDYSPQQLETNGAKQLVAFLDHKSLDVRVLAFETLRHITGFTQNYRPELSLERRNLPVKKWNEKLREGLIVYKSTPSPFPERKGAPAVRAVTDDPIAPNQP